MTNDEILAMDPRTYVKEIITTAGGTGVNLADVNEVGEEVFDETWKITYSGNYAIGPYMITAKINTVNRFIQTQLG